ncbi:Cytochrome c oxidase polypeptide II [Rubellimicrobium mesophilum DSM 19309]|uniref:Cytochrome c oxidase subunit 2 n=1 Tax=Rubellimicrobium mesophilum DSM 19309 TaxID=442562 RepID=A0A017HTJ2_9RHOB|nr:cytochrome c oxidase subunit II [Rubellimicrobium mesophilum]EYD77832.1 Cytochrome c oxidase polypeptide II [Rubellimicrobium mesophilum DSM 19309]
MSLLQTFRTLAAATGATLLGGAAWAQEAADNSGAGLVVDGLPVIGQPHQGGIALQPAMSTVAENTHWLDGMVLWIISAIVLFVMLLLVVVIFRFNERRNPTPARFTHNSPLEIAWTIVPIVILVFIGAFSLPVLFDQQEIPEGDIHIKVTGYQWFWHYDYPDEAISFDSYMIGYGEGNLNPDISAALQEAGFTDQQFKLATDTYVVVPVGATVVVTVTGGDVIHSWKVPAFGVMQDAVPGRLAHLWFKAEQEGIFFGQCSELCGKDHAFMPIQVRVVSQEAYDAWVQQAKVDFPSPAS